MSDKIGIIRYVTIGGYSGDCKMRIEDDQDRKYTDYRSFDSHKGVPIVVDLSEYVINEGDKFKLHSKVGGNHVDSAMFTYSEKGGLLYGSIDDHKGHFVDFDSIGP